MAVSGELPKWLARIELAHQLQAMQGSLGDDEVAANLGIARPFWGRIKASASRPTPEILEAAITFFGFSERQARELRNLLEVSSVGPTVANAFPELNDLEQLAATAIYFAPKVFPPSLRTGSYSRSLGVERGGSADYLPPIDETVLRPVDRVLVISETALRSQVGGDGVLANQLAYLVSLVEQGLSLRVVPQTAGDQDFLAFSAFQFDGLTIPGITVQDFRVPGDAFDDLRYFVDDQVVAEYLRFVESALSQNDSIELLGEVAAEHVGLTARDRLPAEEWHPPAALTMAEAEIVLSAWVRRTIHELGAAPASVGLETSLGAVSGMRSGRLRPGEDSLQALMGMAGVDVEQAETLTALRSTAASRLRAGQVDATAVDMLSLSSGFRGYFANLNQIGQVVAAVASKPSTVFVSDITIKNSNSRQNLEALKALAEGGDFVVRVVPHEMLFGDVWNQQGLAGFGNLVQVGIVRPPSGGGLDTVLDPDQVEELAARLSHLEVVSHGEEQSLVVIADRVAKLPRPGPQTPGRMAPLSAAPLTVARPGSHHKTGQTSFHI